MQRWMNVRACEGVGVSLVCMMYTDKYVQRESKRQHVMDAIGLDGGG